MHKDVYMPMIGTAEVVGKRYGIGRDRQDAYALQSQQRTAAAQAAGKFDDEIVPVTATMAVKDKETGEVSMQRGHASPRTRATAPTPRSRACRACSR